MYGIRNKQLRYFSKLILKNGPIRNTLAGVTTVLAKCVSRFFVCWEATLWVPHGGGISDAKKYLL